MSSHPLEELAMCCMSYTCAAPGCLKGTIHEAGGHVNRLNDKKHLKVAEKAVDVL